MEEISCLSGHYRTTSSHFDDDCHDVSKDVVFGEKHLSRNYHRNRDHENNHSNDCNDEQRRTMNMTRRNLPPVLPPPSPIADLNLVVDDLLQQMHRRFHAMSVSLLGKMDEMSKRMDALESSMAELMENAGLDQSDAELQKSIPKQTTTERKISPSKGTMDSPGSIASFGSSDSLASSSPSSLSSSSSKSNSSSPASAGGDRNNSKDSTIHGEKRSPGGLGMTRIDSTTNDVGRDSSIFVRKSLSSRDCSKDSVTPTPSAASGKVRGRDGKITSTCRMVPVNV